MIETWHGMGTSIEVHGATLDAIVTARSMFDNAEERFSRFLPSSELSAINRADGGSVSVSLEMAEVLGAAAELTERTDGLVDPGIGAALVDWGYVASFAPDIRLDERPQRRSRPQWTIEGRTLTMTPDTRLDLGGFVKGWTCDQVVESGTATLASAGGDLRSRDAGLVVDVLDANDTVATRVHLGVGAFATSSVSKRRWQVADTTAHHIIDPRTMAPSRGPVVSASVAADTAIEAEAGAKAVLLQGVDGLAWADRQPWIRFAMAIWNDGSIYGTTVRRAS
jgi:thiamine biosynthesis lipoprotein